MANTLANPGYLGTAKIGDVTYRCSDISLIPTQDLLFYDHVMGLKDIVEGSDTKGASEEDDYINKQKILWRGSTIKYEGGISFPVAVSGSCSNVSSNLIPLFLAAKHATEFDIAITQSCLSARLFKNCKINSLSIQATAGDVVTANANIVAMDAEDIDPGDLFQDNQKLITWDQVVLDGGGGFDNEQIDAFSMDINNNINTIYTHGSLKPRELRVGMQEVKGTVTLYNKHGTLILPLEGGDIEMNLKIFDLNTPIHCVLQPSAINGTISSLFSVIPFTGVDRVFGEGDNGGTIGIGESGATV